jgi:hypothetical protein
VADQGQWEKYKTATMFDATEENPWWLETGSLTQP